MSGISACDKTDEAETVYVYFKDNSLTIVESEPDQIKIPVSLFADGDVTSDITVNYSLEGNENGIVVDNGEGSLTFPAGFMSQTDYITLSVEDNATGDGDALVSIQLSTLAGNVTLGIGDGVNNQNSTFALTVLDDDISCLAELWTGNVTCTDGVWPSWSPTYCTGVKGEDCQALQLTFDFWAMSSLETVLDLQLGDIDPDTKQGTVTLLTDFNAVGGGYDVTFHAGPAGTYDGNTFELKLDIAFSGYDVGSETYAFTIKK